MPDFTATITGELNDDQRRALGLTEPARGNHHVVQIQAGSKNRVASIVAKAMAVTPGEQSYELEVVTTEAH